MKKITKVLCMLLTGLLLLPFMSTTAVYAADAAKANVVLIADANLRSAILGDMGKPQDYVLTEKDLEHINYINATNRNVTTLEGLQYCKNLQRLEVNYNKISDVSPICKLPKLRELYLNGNKLSDITLLGNLTTLDTLNIDTNQITDISALANLRKLETLNLNDNKIVDLKPLSGLTSLKYLYISRNAIYDLSPLANLFKLKYGEAYGQNIAGKAEKDFKGVITMKNPLINVAGTPMKTLCNLSPFGVFNEETNTCSWERTNPNENLINFTFYKADAVGKAIVGFSGTVSADIRNLPIKDDDSVLIPDPNLRACIKETLGKDSNYTITKQDLASITQLFANNRGIKNIEGLQYCTNLVAITLADNEVSDLTPLQNLNKNLTWINLNNNKITDISPVSKMTNLDTLNASYNSISDISSLKNLKHLKYLYIFNNNISDISAVGEIPTLEGLSLAYNKVSDISSLAKLTDIKDLYLNANSLSDISALKNYTKLQNLSLADNKVSDISNLKNSTDMRIFYVTNNNLTDISVLAGFTKLEGLSIGNNNVSDVTPLANLNNLRIVYIYGNHLKDFSAVTKLPNIVYLSAEDQVID